mmetsp:Transcript_86277/g.140024  ORF Transcript_86277/g.140024 Transcript_86277/m.140024 type:complete len:202 (-) Transcript_86277:678-1283(-)
MPLSTLCLSEKSESKGWRVGKKSKASLKMFGLAVVCYMHMCGEERGGCSGPRQRRNMSLHSSLQISHLHSFSLSPSPSPFLFHYRRLFHQPPTPNQTPNLNYPPLSPIPSTTAALLTEPPPLSTEPTSFELSQTRAPKFPHNFCSFDHSAATFPITHELEKQSKLTTGTSQPFRQPHSTKRSKKSSKQKAASSKLDAAWTA